MNLGEPRAFLEHLYREAVYRALPLANMGAFLPSPRQAGHWCQERRPLVDNL